MTMINIGTSTRVAPQEDISIHQKIRGILYSLECIEGYHEREEVAQLTVQGETFEYRKRSSRSLGSPALDVELKSVLFSAEEFSISTQLTPAGRLTFFGLQWNGYKDRALRDVTVTFKKNEKDLFEIVNANVWSENFLDPFGEPYADERLIFEKGKLVKVATDLSLNQIVELIKAIPEYDQRDIDVTLNVGGERISLKRGQVTPSIPERILASKLKEHTLIIVDTKLSGTGGLSYLGLSCKLGDGLEERRGVFYFAKKDGEYFVQQCDLYGRTASLKDRILLTICRSEKPRSEDRLSTNVSIDEIIDEINTDEISPNSREVQLLFENKQFRLNVSHLTLTNLELVLYQKLRELPSFHMTVDIPAQIGCRELSVLNFLFCYKSSDLGKRVTVLCMHGSSRGTIIRDELETERV